jgi:ribosomal protein L11 methyltransferase
MAFGTGHHATTRGCMRLMERLARRGWHPRRVADVGCGTGVLAMAAARRWRAPVLAGDVEGIAVATARENARANGLAPWIRVVQAPGLRHPAFRHAAPFDLVLANILAGPLKRLAPQIAAALAPGGMAILAGLLAAQAPGVAAVFSGHGLTVVDSAREEGWTSLALRRRCQLPAKP